MIVDIHPQWKKLSNWYWDSDSGISIWEMLREEYGAFKTNNLQGREIFADFPSEASYSAFLLRWA